MKKIFLITMGIFSFFLFGISARASETDDIADEISAIVERDDCIEKTTAINRKDLEIIEASESLEGQKISCLGDSITEGAGGSKDESGNYISYTDHMEDITGAEVVNLGIGGTAIGDYWDENSFILRFNEIPSDSDIIIIFGGVNDFFIGPDIGDQDSSGTYRGDTFSLFWGIRNYYPEAEIYVVTTYKNGAESWFPDHSLSDYMEIQKEYATEFGFHIIDLFDSGFLNCRDNSAAQLWVPDGIHPNDTGNEILAERIVSEIYQNH